MDWRFAIWNICSNTVTIIIITFWLICPSMTNTIAYPLPIRSSRGRKAKPRWNDKLSCCPFIWNILTHHLAGKVWSTGYQWNDENLKKHNAPYDLSLPYGSALDPGSSEAVVLNQSSVVIGVTSTGLDFFSLTKTTEIIVAAVITMKQIATTTKTFCEVEPILALNHSRFRDRLK